MKPDRTLQPPLSIPDEVSMPASQLFTAANGVRLYTLNSGHTGVIRLSLVFEAGTSWQEKPFTASTVVNLLNQGTATYSAAEIAEKVDFYGAFYEVNIDRDYAVVTICSLSKFFAETLALLREILLQPSFPEHELRTYADKRKVGLDIERNKVSHRARELFGQALFGEGHPYGVFSPAVAYDSLYVAGLRDFYVKHYTAENCFAVSSGLLTPPDIAAMQAFVEMIPDRGATESRDFPEISPTRYVYEEKEGAIQSAIQVGRLMFPRSHPDYIGMQVLCTVLGGYFGSRLISNLREDKGYTYGIYAAMVTLDKEGYMAIATEVGAQLTERAVEEIFSELERLREEPVPEEELHIVKNMITGETMRIMDGPFGIADIAIENIQNGFDSDYISRFLQRVKSVTAAELQSLA